MVSQKHVASTAQMVQTFMASSCVSVELLSRATNNQTLSVLTSNTVADCTGTTGSPTDVLGGHATSSGVAISKQHFGRDDRSQYSRTGTPTISVTNVSIARQTAGCFPVNADNGHPAPRMTRWPFDSTAVRAP